MLSKQHRILSGDDYRKVVRLGKRKNCRACTVHCAPTEPQAPARFGFIVSRAVGKAHQRNLIRRRLKAISVESVRSGLQGCDIVYRAHPASLELSFTALRRELLNILDEEISAVRPQESEQI